MGWITQAVITGTTAFIATNIDDIVILMLFFAQVNTTFRPRHIIIGQYLGFAVLILASLPGFFGGLLIPREWIGLLGFLPIAIGLKQWFSPDDDDAVKTVSDELMHPTEKSSLSFNLAKVLAPQSYSVAAVTIANGGDNIGIYIPLFANSNLTVLGITLIVFFVLIAVWCAVAYRLAHFPAIAHVLTRHGHAIVPFVLIGLGIFILVESKTYRLLNWS
ncbi:cadmium resistance transporter [Oscillatoria sp. FACHB-1407]|uniref:cadmium resistance transporter n=1 Tax=Oscillatoria sp. FACHB-1407 TaxID=2692847 RepID=UPI001685126B|nr:cadmium resistance transporter [Oscillatoria sp. FACHB-1407]MBD2461871.1 cadmium resistance transporter [Oscillatoria sp. FACHB-1407]